jgi:hypothetical protein
VVTATRTNGARVLSRDRPAPIVEHILDMTYDERRFAGKSGRHDLADPEEAS